MGTMGIRNKSSARIIKAPTLILYTSEAEGLFSSGDQELRIRDDMTPLQLTMGSGPEGSTLDVRFESEYFIKSGRDQDEIEDLRRLTFVLVAQSRVGRRTVRQVLFRGWLSDESLRHDEANDIVSFTCSDWNQFHRAPIDIPEGLGYNLGQYMYSFNAGWIYVFDMETDSLVKTYYRQHPMVETVDGDSIHEIDEALIASSAITGKVSFENVQFSQAFSDLVSKQGWVPAIKYKRNGGAILQGVQRGTVERELIVRAVGIANYDEVEKENVKSWNGRRTHNVFTRLIGEGAPVETFEVIDLDEGWTDAQEINVLADLTLNKTQERYNHVGRFYKLPKRVHNQSASANGFSSDDLKEDSVRLFVRNRASDDWRPYKGNWSFVATRKNRETGGLSVDDPEQYVAGKHGRIGGIWFEDPLEWGPLYSDAEQTTRASGTPVEGAFGFCEVKVEAVVIGDPLEVTVASDVDFPFQATKVIKDESAKKHNHISHAVISSDDESVSFSSDPLGLSDRDDTPRFRSRLQSLIKRFEEPGHSENITLTNADFSWWWDNVITLVSDVTGFIVFEDIKLYVEGISHDLQEMTTTITLSNTLSKVNQGGR